MINYHSRLLLFLVAICIRCIQSPSRFTPIVVGPICASFGMIVFWLSPYWPSKWSVDQDTIPESDTRALQNSSTDETNTNPKLFRRLRNLFSIPRGSWYSEKTAVEKKVWSISTTGAPASLRRWGQRGGDIVDPWENLTITDTSLIVREGEKKRIWDWERGSTLISSQHSNIPLTGVHC
jgi:hypothetical protein